MSNFRVDIYAWIPQADVPNPINMLPGGVQRWGARRMRATVRG